MRGQIGDLSGRETWHFDVTASVIWLNFSYNPRKCLLGFEKGSSIGNNSVSVVVAGANMSVIQTTELALWS
jgi:hypothetical protein